MPEWVALGALQGVLEWLPVSSEGAVAALHGWLYRDGSFGDAVAYALWLHMGTAVAAAAAFWRTLFGLARDAARSPRNPPALLRYLVASSAVSAAIGFPLLAGASAVAGAGPFGAAAMGAVGALMVVTGALQLRGRGMGAGIRGADAVSMKDAALAGAAQGLAALPGLSRSGLTVAALMARGIDRGDALRLSFLMSVPASAGAGVYAGAANGFFASGDALLAMCVAAVAGLATIKALLRVAERVSFGLFAVIAGAAMVGGAAWMARQGLG